MSYSSLYMVYKTRVREVAEFRNGWGTAPVIWDHLGKNYLGKEEGWWLLGSGNQPLWDLVKDNKVPRFLRLSHAFTFNNVVVGTGRINEVAEACAQAFDATNAAALNRVNHWKAIADALKSLKPDRRAMGVALSCTSVSDPWSGWKGGKVVDPFVLIGEE